MEKRIKDNRPYVLLKNVRYFLIEGIWYARKGFNEDGSQNLSIVKDADILTSLKQWEQVM